MLTWWYLHQPRSCGSIVGPFAEGVARDEPSSVDQCRCPAWARGPRRAPGPSDFPFCCERSASSHGAVSGMDDRLDRRQP